VSVRPTPAGWRRTAGHDRSGTPSHQRVEKVAQAGEML
jgi:hypothetical protein